MNARTFRSRLLAAGLVCASVAYAQNPPASTTPPPPAPPEQGDAAPPPVIPRDDPTQPQPIDSERDHGTPVAPITTARNAPPRADFGALDRNGDGTLSPDELSGSGMILTDCDRDGDGKVTREEYAVCSR